jgi:putative transcriptional regulator
MPLRVTLQKAMIAYKERTGREITYEELSQRTGLSRPTIESIASRVKYNATIDSISRLCDALDAKVDDLFEKCSDKEAVTPVNIRPGK